MTSIFYHPCFQCGTAAPYKTMGSILVEAAAPEYGQVARLVCPRCHNRAKAAQWRKAASSVLLAPLVVLLVLAVLSTPDMDPYKLLPAILPTVIVLTLAASLAALLTARNCERKAIRHGVR